MKKLITICLVTAIFAVADASVIDLSGTSTGTLITAPGGSFATLFAGQTAVGGSGVSGSPTGPLTLAPTFTLNVGFWDGSKSILPEPDNAGPLSLLLDTQASSITWTMGFVDSSSSSLDIDFFASDGSLVQSVHQSLTEGYNSYSYGGFGVFAGLTIYNDNDVLGLRFLNFVYVPEPATVAILSIGVLSLIRRKK